jgi:hypothetical protein
MLRFPSTEWFAALKSGMEQAPERYRQLGTVDIVLVAKIDGADHELFEIGFEGYRCTGVRALASIADAKPGAVVLEGDAATWREMIEATRRNGKADLPHTLNTLTIADTPMRVSGASQLDVDRFYRYQETLQEFFDEASSIETSFGSL